MKTIFHIIFAIIVLQVPSGSFASGEPFSTDLEPVFKVDFNLLAHLRLSPDLADPAKHLPQSTSYPFQPLAALYRYASTCKLDLEIENLQSIASLAKAFEWHHSICEGLDLRSNFFSSPPFLHPAGYSYAAMAYRLHLPGTQEENWMKVNSAYFHLLEFREPDLEKFQSALTPEEKLLVQLDANTLFLMWQGMPEMDSDLFHIVRELQATGPGHANYRVYRQTEWQDEAARISGTSRMSRKFLFSLLLFALLLLAATVLRLIYLRWQNSRLQILRLQILAHEIRTPLAGMQLATDSLSQEFDTFSEVAQDRFLSFKDSLARLNRIVERSTLYLKSRRGFYLNIMMVESMNEYLDQLLSSYASVKFIPLPIDTCFHTDPFWIGVLIKNLVENALQHGIPPVSVLAEADGNRIRILIKDHGRIRGRLRNLRKAPAGSKNGLGFGLSIAQRVARELNAKLFLRNEPTTFILELSKKNENSSH